MVFAASFLDPLDARELSWRRFGLFGPLVAFGHRAITARASSCARTGMKLLGSMGDAFTRGKANSYGQVTLLPEEIEDLWHTYNLIAKGDKLLATTFRKVQKLVRSLWRP